MKCAYCGKNNKEGALYCKRCGIGLPVTPPPPNGDKAADHNNTETALTDPVDPAFAADPPKGKDDKSRKRKRTAALIIAVLIALAAIALAIYIAAVSRAEILPAGNSYTLVDGGAFYKGRDASSALGKIVSSASSIDGSTVGMLTEDGILYCLRQGEQRLVARYVSRFVVSVDGKHFIYTDTNGLLWSCDCSDPENAPVCICNDLVGDDFVVSPDGASVLLSKQIDQNLYLYSDKKLRPIATNQSPISVSNGAKYIYGFNAGENALYMTDKRGNTAFIRSNIGDEIYLSSTREEIAFSTNSGEGIVITMVCAKGGAPVEVINSAGPVSPVITVSGVRMTEEVSGHTVVTCPLKTFEGKMFAGSGLAAYSKEGSKTLEPNECTFAKATDDYRSVYYVMNGVLTKRDTGEEAEPTRLAENCVGFDMIANGSRIWFITADGSLFCKVGGNEQLIAGNVTEVKAKPNSADALFVMNGTLLRNSGGNSRGCYAFNGAYTQLAADPYGMYAQSSLGSWTICTTGGTKVEP